MRSIKWFAVAALVVATVYSLAANADDKTKIEIKKIEKIGGIEYEVLESPGSPDDAAVAAPVRASAKAKKDAKEKKRPLGAYLPHGWFWAGVGDLHSKKWDGGWSSIEGGVNLLGSHQLYVGFSEYDGRGPVLGSATKYRGAGEERRVGWQIVNSQSKEQDEARIAYFAGEDKGSNTPYRQETEFRGLDLRLARTWYRHDRTFLPGGTIEFKWRYELHLAKESSFAGKKLNRSEDPADGPGMRHLQLAPDLVHKMWRQDRISLAPVYERQWWEDQSPIERDLWGARIRLTHRNKGGSAQGNLDLMPYRVSTSKGFMFGMSWSF